MVGKTAWSAALAGLVVQVWVVLGLAALVSWLGVRSPRLDRPQTTSAGRGEEKAAVPDAEATVLGGGSRLASSLRVATGNGPPGLIHLLGQYGIEGPGGEVGGRGRDGWALLGLLAEHRTALLTRAVAQDRLWPDVMPSADKFANLLKETRSKLCDALERPGGYGRVVIQFAGSTGYRINPELFTCDVWLLHDLLARAATATGSEKPAALREAVGLYSGPYLADVPHSWARTAAESVTRDVVKALVQLADLEGSAEGEAHYLERATELDKSAEHLFRRRMETYARLGRTQAIHYCYDELCTELKSLGRSPGAQTEKLYVRVTGVA